MDHDGISTIHNHSHRIHVCFYGNIYHQYTPNVSIWIPYIDSMGYYTLPNGDLYVIQSYSNYNNPYQILIVILMIIYKGGNMRL